MAQQQKKKKSSAGAAKAPVTGSDFADLVKTLRRTNKLLARSARATAALAEELVSSRPFAPLLLLTRC